MSKRGGGRNREQHTREPRQPGAGVITGTELARGVGTNQRETEINKQTEKFPREPETPQAARRFVESTLHSWDLTELANDANLIVSELVTNAVCHTNSDAICVIVDRIAERRVHLGVADGSRTMPFPGHPSLDATRGRGLLLIDTLAYRWGTNRHHWGKQVWAELRVGDE
ncbi:ATP-binding protein [Streptomyces chartreusis]